jgi:hypothetical protein
MPMMSEEAKLFFLLDESTNGDVTAPDYTS